MREVQSGETAGGYGGNIPAALLYAMRAAMGQSTRKTRGLLRRGGTKYNPARRRRSKHWRAEAKIEAPAKETAFLKDRLATLEACE